MAAALAMGMGIKTAAAARHRPDDLAASRPTQVLPATPARPVPLSTQAASPTVAPPPVTAVSTVAVTPSAAPLPPSAPALAASAATPDAPVADPAPAPDPARAKDLTKKALQLLERGNNKGAIEQATAAVDADPTDAAPYLYWGTALMELGKHKDAKAIFARCVDQATRGPKSDCRQFR